MSEPTSPTQSRQTEIYLDGVRGKLPVVPIDFTRLEARAQASLPAAAFDYFAGGAGLERTMAANRGAFDRWQIVPRMLRGIESRDTSIELFGRRIPAPL